jgi:putative acetyltransferase
MAFEIRAEAEGDRAAIFQVHRAAFDTELEARLVDQLRAAGALTLSLMAVEDGLIVGHVAFRPVTIAVNPGGARALGLGPIGVLPACQRRGIGTHLIEASLREAADGGWDLVFVLGEPGYYTRFGFEPTATHGLRCGYDAPPEAFMVTALRPSTLGAVSGIVRYHPAFDAV